MNIVFFTFPVRSTQPSLYEEIFALTTEVLFLAGGFKQFFEMGIGDDYGAVIVGDHGRIAYRYAGPNGFLLKAGLQIDKNV